MVEQIYEDFLHATGKNNRMDKTQFRRLYKEMYQNGQSGKTVAPFLTDHDLDKISDHVFENYDFDSSGKIYIHSLIFISLNFVFLNKRKINI
jgi:hypothetical protein